MKILYVDKTERFDQIMPVIDILKGKQLNPSFQILFLPASFVMEKETAPSIFGACNITLFPLFIKRCITFKNSSFVLKSHTSQQTRSRLEVSTGSQTGLLSLVKFLV